MKAYQQLKAEQQKEFNDFPCFFAFNERQFKEGKEKLGVKEDEELCSTGVGMIIRKEDVERLKAMTEGFSTALATNLEDEVFLFDAVSYEIANHEYVITGDLDESLDILGLQYDKLTKEQRAVISKAVSSYMEAADA